MLRDDWSQSAPEWEAFLEHVRIARAAVGATYAASWFRGQTHDWPLIPSLFRATAKISERIRDLQAERQRFYGLLKGAKRFAKRAGTESDAKIHEITQTIQMIDARVKLLKSRLPHPETGVVHGEGRAFIEYRFRSGVQHQSSWQTLAEMQHYGVPTRLLDWSESFVSSLAFALADYIKALEEIWSHERSKVMSRAANRKLTYHEIGPFGDEVSPKRPVLWVMNPYRLSESSTFEDVLWDLTLRPEDDYYNHFIARGSDKFEMFRKPVPMLTPWRDERIAAQQGVFTCFGARTEPLDQMFSKNTLRKVEISPCAAVHGVRFLYEFGGIDAFTMFRDKDTLGKKTTKEFFYEFTA